MAFLVAFLGVVRICAAQECANSAQADACEWAAITNGKKYSFNLVTPIKGYPHGVLSEDGYCFLWVNHNLGLYHGSFALSYEFFVCMVIMNDGSVAVLRLFLFP